MDVVLVIFAVVVVGIVVIVMLGGVGLGSFLVF